MSKRKQWKPGTGARFWQLPQKLMDHPAVRTLSHAEHRVLIALLMQFDGKNNGAIGLTPAQAMEHGIASKNTLYRAMKKLAARKLIEQTYPASRTPPRPAMYSLSWISEDNTDFSTSRHVPTHAYQNWKPLSSDSRRVSSTNGWEQPGQPL